MNLILTDLQHRELISGIFIYCGDSMMNFLHENIYRATVPQLKFTATEYSFRFNTLEELTTFLFSNIELLLDWAAVMHIESDTNTIRVLSNG